MRCSTSELTAHLGGDLVGPDVSIEGASIDSRTIRPGQLYAPIVAERDGHAFIPAALEAGAPAYLTAREPVGGTAIRVRDTAAALLSLGALARGRVGGAIGITGSVGKTTTKDLLAACLASTFRTAASERSFNNELGLPLTLLGAPDAARWVVLEMGARRVGDIEQLAEVARPSVGIVTSVDMAHVEYLGDLDGVARAKGELVAALPASGLAVLNFDDPRVRDMASLSACPVLGYALGADADVRAEDVTLDRDLRARFRLSSPWGQTEVRLALHGAHQVTNALAAATVALWCGVPIETVAAALAVSRGSPWRMEVHRVAGGPVLVVDCFNAVPASAEAAVRSLAALPGERKLALLGLMAELGDQSESEHRRIALVAEELGIEVVGYETGLYGEAHVTGVDEAVALLRTMGPGDVALVKGSRVARLEDVVRAYGKAEGAPSLAPAAARAGAGAGAKWPCPGPEPERVGRAAILQPKISSGPSTDHGRPAGRRERQRVRMRERLLSAALDLFAANGFADTTIDQIAERADVARQTVLNHFPHKTDFAKEWGQGRRDQLAAIGVGVGSDESARALVRRYFAAAAEMNERERDLTRAMLDSLTPTEVFLNIAAVPAAAIERGQEQGEFSSAADPGVASEILTSIYFGTVSRWLIHGPPPFDLARALAQRLDLVLAGLQPR